METIQFTLRAKHPLVPEERIGISYDEFLEYLAMYNLLDTVMLEDPVAWLKRREKGKKGGYDGSAKVDGISFWWVW